MPILHNKLASLIYIPVVKFNSICTPQPLLQLSIIQLRFIRVPIAMLRFMLFFLSIIYILIPSALSQTIIIAPLFEFVSFS